MYDKLQSKRTFTPRVSNYHNIADEWNADVAIHGTQSARHGWEWYEIGFFACWTQSRSLTLLFRSAREVAVAHPVNDLVAGHLSFPSILRVSAGPGCAATAV